MFKSFFAALAMMLSATFGIGSSDQNQVPFAGQTNVGVSAFGLSYGHATSDTYANPLSGDPNNSAPNGLVPYVGPIHTIALNTGGVSAPPPNTSEHLAQPTHSSSDAVTLPLPPKPDYSYQRYADDPSCGTPSFPVERVLQIAGLSGLSKQVDGFWSVEYAKGDAWAKNPFTDMCIWVVRANLPGDGPGADIQGYGSDIVYIQESSKESIHLAI